MIRSKISLVIILMIVLFTCFTSIIAIGYSHSCGVNDGIYIRYQYSAYNPVKQFSANVMKIEFSNDTMDLFHTASKYGNDEPSTWDEDINTRIVSNVDPGGDWLSSPPPPYNGTHTPFWIFTNFSLNDQVKICVYKVDQVLNITSFQVLSLSGYEPVVAWKLEDSLGSVAFYENTTGILINGTFNMAMHPGYWEKYEFLNTNALTAIPENPGIPGYSYLLMICIIAVVSMIILKKCKINKK